MTYRLASLSVLLVLLLHALAPVPRTASARDASAPPPSRPVLPFVENVGQFDPAARFQARSGDATLWLAEDALWITVVRPAPAAAESAAPSHPAPVCQTSLPHAASRHAHGPARTWPVCPRG